MLLPNRNRAYIPELKLTRYLLSLSHPVGKSKARFFYAHGFDVQNADLMEDRLLQIARENEIRDTKKTPHGTKYVVDGSMQIPRGTTVDVRTVWMMDDDSNPRFVTAHPA